MPPISRTVATTGEGTEDVTEQLIAHREWLLKSPTGANRLKSLVREAIVKYATDSVVEQLFRDKAALLDELAARCFTRELTPLAAVDELMRS